MRRLYHVYSQGRYTIFRNEDDYIFMMNKIAVYSALLRARVHAFCIMSTHMHILLEYEDPEQLVKQINPQYQRHFASAYGICGCRQMFDARAVEGEEDIKEVFEYIMKNPVHHNVSSNVFKYPYSSCECYFPGAVERQRRYCDEDVEMRLIESASVKKVSQLTWKEKRRVFGRKEIFRSFDIKDGKVICPWSYVDRGLIEDLYSTYRSFYFSVTRTTKAASDESDLSGFRISDIKVCSFIDNWCREKGFRSFLELGDSDRNLLIELLTSMKASKMQISRCLWL